MKKDACNGIKDVMSFYYDRLESSKSKQEKNFKKKLKGKKIAFTLPDPDDVMVER